MSSWYREVEKTTTGMEQSRGSPLISASTSCPCFLGRLRSRRIRSGRGMSWKVPSRRSMARASSPSAATAETRGRPLGQGQARQPHVGRVVLHQQDAERTVESHANAARILNPREGRPRSRSLRAISRRSRFGRRPSGPPPASPRPGPQQSAASRSPAAIPRRTSVSAQERRSRARGNRERPARRWGTSGRRSRARSPRRSAGSRGARVGVHAQAQEMEQVVEVDLPVRLGVGGQRQVLPGLLAGHADLDPLR